MSNEMDALVKELAAREGCSELHARAMILRHIRMRRDEAVAAKIEACGGAALVAKCVELAEARTLKILSDPEAQVSFHDLVKLLPEADTEMAPPSAEELDTLEHDLGIG